MFKVNSLHFVAKPFSFNIDRDANKKAYSKLIKSICDGSLSDTNCKQIKDIKLLNPFIDDFFSHYGSNYNSKITIFNGNNGKKCIKSDFSLFYLKLNTMEVFYDSLIRCEKYKTSDNEEEKTIQDILISDFREMMKKAECLKENYNSKMDGLIGSFMEEVNKLNFENNISGIQSFVNSNNKQGFISFAISYEKLKAIIKRIENINFCKNILGKDYEIYKELNKRYKRIRTAISVISFHMMGIRTINCLLLSKYGIASICAVSEMENVISLVDENQLPIEAHKQLRNIESRTTKLTEMFEILTDYSFVFKDTIFGNFELLLDEPTRKGIYLNFLYNCSKKEKLPLDIDVDRAVVTLFDYISVATCYGRNFNEVYLWNYSLKPKEEKDSVKEIEDLRRSSNEHVYYDDNCFVLSVLNPAYLFDTESDLANKLGVYRLSHQSKIYSLWFYESICESLAFGSIGIRVYKMFNSVANYLLTKTHWKIKRVYNYHKVAKFFANLLGTFNLDLFASKNYSSEMCNIVFFKLGLSDIVRYTASAFDNNWKDANLGNGQAYSRFALFLSIGTALITILSYGMISKVYIDGYHLYSECVENQPPSNWFGLIGDAATTAKMWLVLMLPLLSFLIMLVIYLIESCSYRRFSIIKEYNKLLYGNIKINNKQDL